jgi:hypothetical protein
MSKLVEDLNIDLREHLASLLAPKIGSKEPLA